MLSSKLSIKAFGVYVLLTGFGLLLAPNLLPGVFGIAPTVEVWVRVLGAPPPASLQIGFFDTLA